MTDLITAFGPWAVYLVAMGLMLKWLVTDKIRSVQKTLESITDSLEGHDERIREIETKHAELLGGLKAKGCLGVNGVQITCEQDRRGR